MCALVTGVQTCALPIFLNERFEERMGDEARIKVTAPERLIRNRKARPDAWEAAVLAEKVGKPEWPKGEPFIEITEVDGVRAFRMLVPANYEPSCRVCHGEPACQVRITGSPTDDGTRTNGN